MQRYRFFIGGGAVAFAILIALFIFGGKSGGSHKSSNVVNIMPVLPPPPPPPPPQPTPPPQDPPPQPDTVKQPEFQAEEKPEAAKEPPAPEAAPPMGSDIQGDGADGFGLSGKGGGGLIGGNGKGSGTGGASRWGWYAGEVQTSVVDALRNHKKTRSANISIKVRIWADATGRVTRATLVGSTGDAEVDRAIQGEILTGLRLQEAPPEGMPMPIVMRITAKKPN